MTNDSGTAQKILKAATAEFSENGLAGARIDRIASRANVNKAMIYYHFSSKERLYQSILDRQIAKIRHFFNEKIPGEATPEKIFENLASFYAGLFEDRTMIPILLRELVKRLKKILRDAIERGEFRDVDERHTIASFVGMNLYYLIMAPLINHLLEIEDEEIFRKMRPQEVTRLFLEGVKVR
jgi:AcrR family transcriptional regulator